jgi:DMSO reductase anchor subunit
VLKIPSLLGTTTNGIQHALSVLTSTIGFIAVSCSVFIYVVTQRKWWSGTATGIKFFGTAALLGLSTMAVTTCVTARLFPEAHLEKIFATLAGYFVIASALKLVYEASMFHHLWDKQQGDLKRTAILMKRDLKDITIWRFISGGVGGILIPGLLLLSGASPGAGSTLALSLVALLFALAGEFLERTLFFTAVSAPRMPGAIGK